jgi:GTP-binding protein YchF
MAAMEVELVLADLVVAEGARDKATRNARSGEAEAKKRLDLLQRVCAILEEERPLRTHDGWTDGDRMLLKSYGFITAKPVLHVVNVTEDDMNGSGPAAVAAGERAKTRGEECVAVCAQLEAELAELDDADRDEMLGSLGLSEPAIGPLARAANQALGLTTFYTAGEKEVRAWAIPIGAPAPAAAGTIHSDIERGFIRAECYGVDDLIQYGNEKSIKEAGKMRSEGKSYAMQDGDVVHFLFNV